MYAQLLMDLFKFLTPFLRNAELTKPAQLLYKVSETGCEILNLHCLWSLSSHGCSTLRDDDSHEILQTKLSIP